MKNKDSNRRGLIAGGNWIIDQVKLIDVYPQREQLGSVDRVELQVYWRPRAAVNMVPELVPRADLYRTWHYRLVSVRAQNDLIPIGHRLKGPSFGHTDIDMSSRIVSLLVWQARSHAAAASVAERSAWSRHHGF